MPEKWNIEIKYTQDSQGKLTDSGLKEHIKRNARANEGFKVAELEKNEMEKGVISDINMAVQSFLEKQGLPALSVDEEFVHILSEDDYLKQRELYSPGSVSAALFCQGHIYHPRINNKLVLARNLAHEFVHELSFLKKEVKLSEEDDKLFVNYHSEKRRGYGANTKKSGDLGRGFNEAMTELASLDIMRGYAGANKLREEDVDVLFGEISYYPHILVVENLFEKVFPNKPERARSLFYHGYFTGGSKALKGISMKLTQDGIKDGLKALYQMDASPESALAVAKRLKLKKAVKGIEEFVDEKD